jgi:hypothetical protein
MNILAHWSLPAKGAIHNNGGFHWGKALSDMIYIAASRGIKFK